MRTIGVLIIAVIAVAAVVTAIVVPIIVNSKHRNKNNSIMENQTNQTSQGYGYSTPQGHQQIIINQQGGRNSNGIGTAGFVLALIALFIGWVPAVGWICWLLGLIFSCVGMGRTPKGLAIAGLIISLFGIVLIIMLTGTSIAILEDLL